MERRTLGRTGLAVSTLGVGGHTYPVGDGPDYYASQKQRAALIGRLLEAGVNYFDTTWLNELELLVDSFDRLGVLDRVNPMPGHAGADPSERIVVSCQAVDGCTDLPDEPREQLRKEVMQRLSLLKLNCLPLFIVGIGNGHPSAARVIDICTALDELRAEGLISCPGLSCHDVTAFDTIADIIEDGARIDYLMLRFNPKWPNAATRLLKVAAEENIGVVLKVFFCYDCPRDASPASGASHMWTRRVSVFEPKSATAESQAASASQSKEALTWVLQHEPIATIVPSINATWEAEANIAAATEASGRPRLAAMGQAAPMPQELAGAAQRLWSKADVQELADQAEAQVIKDRCAAALEDLPPTQAL
jgi:aryl-alcohol dehydrogenase-like predicted oxidoreductase